MVTEEKLKSLRCSPTVIKTYQSYMQADPRPERTLPGIAALAKELGFRPATVLLHLNRVDRAIETGSLPVFPGPGRLGAPSLEETNPEIFAQMVNRLSTPGTSVFAAAKDCGIELKTALRIAQVLDLECQPLKRELVEVRLEDLTRRFGTLARDAIDAITPEKLAGSNAQSLAVISGIAADKWQLLRGQATSRVEINDRREMNELLGEILKEAKRRNIEIDVTPEGEVTAKKSPYRSAPHRDLMKRIESGDPVETFSNG